MEHFWKHPSSPGVKEVLPEVRNNSSRPPPPHPTTTPPLPPITNASSSFSPRHSASSLCHTKGSFGGDRRVRHGSREQRGILMGGGGGGGGTAEERWWLGAGWERSGHVRASAAASLWGLFYLNDCPQLDLCSE